ncbi:hypothetical protein GBAR_LOCUS23309 [Geodia barretti]|uniref:Uncharacterized protein n=1 Tax=Geodia barretti TaxID=519541 RepID=A0AA35T654_GEOBA|nr:hypothetical protein GBAR_LOCUS23309 [Geodia barretti]
MRQSRYRHGNQTTQFLREAERKTSPPRTKTATEK